MIERRARGHNFSQSYDGYIQNCEPAYLGKFDGSFSSRERINLSGIDGHEQ